LLLFFFFNYLQKKERVWNRDDDARLLQQQGMKIEM